MLLHDRLTAWTAGTPVYRAALALALVPACLLVWFYGAVAEPGDSPGPMFLGSIAVLIIGALMARFRPQGMTYALCATALAQAGFGVGAVMAWGQYTEISILNGVFVALWVGSAILFRRAAQRATALKGNRQLE
jgi:Na+/melibiose symporter-like transporter